MAGKRILLKDVIVTFVDQLWVAGIPKNVSDAAKAKASWNCAFLIEEGSDNKKLIEDAINEVAVTEWKTGAQAILNSIKPQSNRYCFRDGNLCLNKDGVPYAGYPGRWALSTKRYPEKGPIIYLNKDKTPITQEHNLLYSGARVNANLDIWTYDKPNKGISSTLNIIQFWKHGDPLGGAAPISEMDMDSLPFDEDEELKL